MSQFKSLTTAGQIGSVKCGMKLGQKMSDEDSKWVEKWYEVRCQDTKTRNLKVAPSTVQASTKKIVTDIIVKYYTKFWTNVEEDTIEGESCLQILHDGSRSFGHDALILELKDNIEMQNILNKTGSLKSRHLSQSHKVVAAQQSRDSSPEKMLDLLNLDGWKNKPKHMTAEKNLHQGLKSALAVTHGSLATAAHTSSDNVSGMKSSVVSTEKNQTLPRTGENT